MEVNLSKRELRLIESAIVRTDEFWTQPGDGGCSLNDRTARRVMEKILEAYEQTDRGKTKRGI